MYDAELPKIERTLRQLQFPKKFAVEVCAECNLACVMCHHPSMRRPKGKMPFELWKRCADQIAAIAPRTECWFSFCGEPLLEAELLLRMLRYGRAVGLGSLNVNTNGVLLTPEVAQRLMDVGVDLIVIGIDGHSPDVFERIRVGARRDVVYRNVEHLLRARQACGHGPEIQVQFIEMQENVHELPVFQAYWLERGAVLKVRNMLSWGGKFGTPLQVAPEWRIACPWALTMMHVFWDGRVPRCPGDTEGEEAVGNAWDEPLNGLWAKLAPYRDKHLQHRFAELPVRCQTCKDWMTGAAKRIRGATVPAAGVRAAS